jgi:hypothetical protein
LKPGFRMSVFLVAGIDCNSTQPIDSGRAQSNCVWNSRFSQMFFFVNHFNEQCCVFSLVLRQKIKLILAIVWQSPSFGVYLSLFLPWQW